MELTGTLKKISEIQTFASGFQKREAVLLTEEQYPQPIAIEFLSDKIELLNNIQEGDKVKIGINIRGREWTSPQGEVKYFNSITAWRLEKLSETPQATASEPTQATPDPNYQKPDFRFDDEEEDDDLPF